MSAEAHTASKPQLDGDPISNPEEERHWCVCGDLCVSGVKCESDAPGLYQEVTTRSL